MLDYMPALMNNPVFIAALRVEHERYKADIPDFWQFAACAIFAAFADNADDECFDWLGDVIAQNREAVLAANPELLYTEDGEMYLADD